MDKRLKNEILELRNQGFSYKQIREKLQCSQSTISYHCRREELSDSNIFRIPSEEEKNEMQKLYDELKSSIKVAKKMGWSKATVLRYIKTIKRTKRTEEKRKEDGVKAVVDWRRRTKIKLVEYKGGKCQNCDYDKCIGALEFHHLNPKEKDFTIGGKSWSFEKLKAEADKCVLLCNRCHEEVHYNITNIEDILQKIENKKNQWKGN